MLQPDGVYRWRTSTACACAMPTASRCAWRLDQRRRRPPARRGGAARIRATLRARHGGERVGYWDWIVPTNRFYASPRAFELVAIRPEPRGSTGMSTGRSINMHPEDFARWEAAREELFAGTGERLSMEVRYVVRGEIRWHILQASASATTRQGHTVDRLGNRHHRSQAGGGRVEDDGAQAAPGAAPRGDGNACGRNRARLQQHPRSDPRQWRNGAARRAQGEPLARDLDTIMVAGERGAHSSSAC
jgi:hypothetical protein